MIMWVVLYQKQSQAFLLSVLAGVVFGLLYDLFRIFRVMWRGGRIKLFFEDMVFSTLSALLLCIFVFNANMGVVRLFMFVGLIIGFFSYRFTFGLLTVPFAKWLKGLVLKPIKTFINKCLFMFLHWRFIINTWCFTLKMKQAAKHGFS